MIFDPSEIPPELLEYFEPVLDGMSDVWLLGPDPYPQAHFATFPREIPRRCILAATRPGDTVLDCFSGSGTSLLVAKQLERRAIGIELNESYAHLATDRLKQDVLPLFGEAPAAARAGEGVR